MSGGEIVPSPSGGGDAISTEISAIEGEMRTGSYWGRDNERKAARYLDLVRQRDNVPAPASPQAWRASPDEARKQMPADVVAAWDEHGQLERNLRASQETIEHIVQGIGDRAEAESFVRGFDTLPMGVQSAAYKELARDVHTFAKPANEEQLAAWRALPDGAALAQAWGPRAASKFGQIQARWYRALGEMSEGERAVALRWIDGMPPRQRVGLFWALAGGP